MLAAIEPDRAVDLADELLELRLNHRLENLHRTLRHLGSLELQLLRLGKADLEAILDRLRHVVAGVRQWTDPETIAVDEHEIRMRGADVENDRRLLGGDIVLHEVQQPEVADGDGLDGELVRRELEHEVVDLLTSHRKDRDLSLLTRQVVPIDDMKIPGDLVEREGNLLSGLVADHLVDLFLLEGGNLDEARKGSLTGMRDSDRLLHRVALREDLQRVPCQGLWVRAVSGHRVVDLVDGDDFDVPLQPT